MAARKRLDQMGCRSRAASTPEEARVVASRRVENRRQNNVSGALYPGSGLEANLGPVGLRLDVGDDIYFNSGTHHNLRVAFGAVIHILGLATGIRPRDAC
jgi:hypothetical protein|nr:hypothetical protein [Candidatus Acidoferrales bacterium]